MMNGQLDERGLARQISVGAFGPFELDYDDRAHLVGLSTPSGAQWRFDWQRTVTTSG